MKGMRVIWSLICVGIAPCLLAQDLTPELILRVLQERQMLLVQRNYIQRAQILQARKYLNTGDFIFIQDVALQDIQDTIENANIPLIEPFDWGNGLAAFPADGDLTADSSITFEEQLAVLNMASKEFDQLKLQFLNVDAVKQSDRDDPDLIFSSSLAGDPSVGDYDEPIALFSLLYETPDIPANPSRDTFFTPDSLPSVGYFTPENYAQKLLLFMERLRHLNYVEWPEVRFHNYQEQDSDWNLGWESQREFPDYATWPLNNNLFLDGGYLKLTVKFDVRADLSAPSVPEDPQDPFMNPPSTDGEKLEWAAEHFLHYLKYDQDGIQVTIESDPDGFLAGFLFDPAWLSLPLEWTCDQMGPYGCDYFNITKEFTSFGRQLLIDGGSYGDTSTPGALIEFYVGSPSTTFPTTTDTDSYSMGYVQAFVTGENWISTGGVSGEFFVLEERNDPWRLFADLPPLDEGKREFKGSYTHGDVLPDPFVFGPAWESTGTSTTRSLGDVPPRIDTGQNLVFLRRSTDSAELQLGSTPLRASAQAVSIFVPSFTHTIPDSFFEDWNLKSIGGGTEIVRLGDEWIYTLALGGGLNTRGNQGRIDWRFHAGLVQPVFEGIRSEYEFDAALIGTDTEGNDIEQLTVTGWQYETVITTNWALEQCEVIQTALDGVSPDRTWMFQYSQPTQQGSTRDQVNITYTMGAISRSLFIQEWPNHKSVWVEDSTQNRLLERTYSYTGETEPFQVEQFQNGVKTQKAKYAISYIPRWGSRASIRRYVLQDIEDPAMAPDRTLDRTITGDLVTTETWDGPGSYTQTRTITGRIESLSRGPYESTWTLTDNNWSRTDEFNGDPLVTTQTVYSNLLEFATTTTTGTKIYDSMGVELLDPVNAAPEEFPYSLKTIDHVNGLRTTNHVSRVGTGVKAIQAYGSLDGTYETRSERTVNEFGYTEEQQITELLNTQQRTVLNRSVTAMSWHGPTTTTNHVTTVNTTIQRNDAGELHTYEDEFSHAEVLLRDEAGRMTTVKNLHTALETTRNPNGNSFSVSATANNKTLTSTRSWNGFGDPTDSGFTGLQPQTGTTAWNGTEWSGTSDNTRTHAGTTSSFHEETLKSIIRSKTGPGQETTVEHEILNGIPCLRIDVAILQIGLATSGKQLVSRTYVDGLGRVHREQRPDPSQTTLVWQSTDYVYDSKGRLIQIDQPVTPDILIEYDPYSRPYREALNLNADQEITPGVDTVLETQYEILNNAWVVTEEVYLNATTKKVLSRTEADALTRSYSQKTGTRTTDEFQFKTIASGHQQLLFNHRVVVDSTPTETILQDTSNDETFPISKRKTTVDILGIPQEVLEQTGPLIRTTTFDEAFAEPELTDNAGITSSYDHAYQPDGSSTHTTDYGDPDGPVVSINPTTETFNVGGKGGMPHNGGLTWNAAGGWKKTLQVGGGNVREEWINPAGLLYSKIHANGDFVDLGYDGAGRLLSETTDVGTQSWAYTSHGEVGRWKVDGVTKYEVLQDDMLGRVTKATDASGTYSVVYDNDKWTQDTKEWTSGILDGFKLDEDADTRGRFHQFYVTKNGAPLYSATHTYRGDSSQLEQIIVTLPGNETVTIGYQGQGGMADILTYTHGAEVTNYIRGRGPQGRVNSITAPTFTESWELDDMGRKHKVTTNTEETTYEYHSINGSLASATTGGNVRTWNFNNSGEQVQEGIFARLADPAGSGALKSKDNKRELRLVGSYHPDSTVEVLLGTNVVHNATPPTLNFTFDQNNVPALVNSNATVAISWSVVGERLGASYEGGKAVSKVSGTYVFAPQNEQLVYDDAMRLQLDGRMGLSWDAADQLLSLQELAGPFSIENVYDGSRRRVEKRVFLDGTLFRTHRFVYQDWLPVVEEVLDSQGNPFYTNSYVWGAGPDGVRNPAIGATGQLALIIHKPKFGGIEVSAPIYNHRLDIVGLVDVKTGNEVASFRYTEFGESVSVTGNRAWYCPFRFAGAYQDETQTYYRIQTL